MCRNSPRVECRVTVQWDKTGHDCARMADFEIISAVTAIEVIARVPRIRDAARLNREHGHGNWRKLKGIALVRLANGCVRKFSSVRIAVPHKAEAWEPKSVIR